MPKSKMQNAKRKVKNAKRKTQKLIGGSNTVSDPNTVNTVEKSKKSFDEWKEIFKLRSNFSKNQFGSRYFMGIFDGKFI